MSTLTGPSASAVTGLPESNNMADIIDSLKRLERIGNEASKTTQKLMDAASQLAEVIVKQYAPSDGEDICLDRTSPGDDKHYYCISKGGVFIAEKRTEDEIFYTHVSSSRSAALKFSEDIAGGMLGLIEADLARRCEANQAALAILEPAASKIGDAKHRAYQAEAKTLEEISARLHSNAKPIAIEQPPNKLTS